jgi:glycosyltransferase involved in cell wall biosynthesis
VPDVIQDGITGRLVESGDVEGLARAMREMLTDRARTRQMAEAARADVSQRYTVEALVRNTEALYERLLHEKGLA